MFANIKLGLKIFVVLMAMSLVMSNFSNCATLRVKKAALKSTTTPVDEMKNIAKQFAATISQVLQTTPELELATSFLALFPTKNNTSNDLPLDYLNFTLVSELLKNNVRTVRIEDRSAAIDELEFQLSGLGDGDLAAGQMKSPNYFIKIVVDENIYLLNSQYRRSERTFNMEVRSVQTQLVILADSVTIQQNVPILRNNYSF